MTLNRVVAIAAVLVSLGLAILPVALNYDWTSTAGVSAGIGAVVLVTLKWLDGWQQYEERVAATQSAPTLPPSAPTAPVLSPTPPVLPPTT